MLTEAADVVPCVDDLISAFVRGLPYVASSSPILFLLLLRNSLSRSSRFDSFYGLPYIGYIPI